MTRRSADSVESVQEGSRWLHNPPTGADFASWFRENVKLHDGLLHEDYINGITLIPNKETVKVTVERNGNLAIEEVERLVFSPYPQVETRERYFWDWCRENDFLGEIDVLGITPQNIKGSNGSVHLWVSAKARVRAYERSPRFPRGREVMLPPVATKTVPLFGRYGPDVNASMKAETGAIGRALGFAGMLVIPGAGISTAEDMHDLAVAQSSPGGEIAPEASLPAPRATEPLEQPTGDQETVLRSMVQEQAEELRNNHTEVWVGIEAWAHERDLNLENPPPAALRSLERQLRRKLDQVKKSS